MPGTGYGNPLRGKNAANIIRISPNMDVRIREIFVSLDVMIRQILLRVNVQIKNGLANILAQNILISYLECTSQLRLIGWV